MHCQQQMIDTLSKCAEASKFTPTESKAASVQGPRTEETITISQAEYRQVVNTYRELLQKGLLRNSEAASLNEDTITISKQEYRNLQDNKCANVIKQVVRKSMAASLQTSGINQAQLIHNFITS